SKTEEKPQTPSAVEESSQATLQILIDGQVATYQVTITKDTNALTLLTDEATKKGWEIEVETYDFGTLVESINGQSNTADKAWIYFVNDQAANVGADQMKIQDGDVVEWKYETFN